MAIIEEVPEGIEPDSSSISKTELLATLRALSAKLRLPEDLLPAFMDESDPSSRSYWTRAFGILREISDLKGSATWTDLTVEEQGEIFAQITRLYGDDMWTSTEIRLVIDDISSGTDTARLALHLLTHTLRPLFSVPHPMLNPTTARALPRPAGGPEAMSDIQNDASQIWKHNDAWGAYNILAWCCAHLPPADIPDRIGLILPPTLMMLDDWDPAWAGRGGWVLDKWVGAMPVPTMRRMGMDKLLLGSLVHLLSRHPTTPVPHVMRVTLELVERTTEGEKKAEVLAEVMHKAVLTGWMYAPSGAEGRVVLIQVARDLEALCEVMQEGVSRWMKSIIPNLLQPLIFTPTPAVLPHFEANLSALLCVLRHADPTGRVPRWRGQILDIVSRLCVQLDEKEKEDAAVATGARAGASPYARLKSQIAAVFALLAELCPTVPEAEYARLAKLDDSLFSPLVQHSVRA